MRNLDPTIKRQEIIRTQLWNALQGDIIGEIRANIKDFDIERNERTNYAANDIKVSETIMPELYALLMEVKSNLNFTDEVELYIQANSEINSFAYESRDPSKPHVISISSAAVKMLTDTEKKYLLGHEFGHIINHDNILENLYHFLFETEEDDWEDEVPLGIMTRYQEYKQLAEFAADRYGYLACVDLQACVSAFFKGSAGLDITEMNVDFDALLDQNVENLQILESYGRLSDGTHPMRPFRIQALVEFACCKTQKDLEENMEHLFLSIPGVAHEEMDAVVAQLLCALGLKIAQADGKVSQDERNVILEEVSVYVLEATKLLKQITKQDLDAVIRETLPQVIESCPDKLDGILNFAIGVSFADNVISLEEVQHLLQIGNMLGVDELDVYNSIQEYIKGHLCHIAEGL